MTATSTARFFLIGRQIAGYEQVVHLIVEEGNVAGDHTWSHPDMVKATPATRRRELDDTLLAIARTTGARPHLFRPPYGAINAAVARTARKLGLLPIY